MYLINKSDITRTEGERDFMPYTARNHYLFFQITQYDPKIEEGIEHFFKNSLLPGDNLRVFTPERSYNLTKEAMQTIPIDKITEDLKTIVRRDIMAGTSEYVSLIKELQRNARNIAATVSLDRESGVLMAGGIDPGTGGGLIYALNRYSHSMQRLESIRTFSIGQFAQFAEILKKQPGENQVHYFFEKEYKPELTPKILNRIQSTYQDDITVMGEMQELFGAYHQSINIDNEKLAQIYADTGALFNFIFLDGKKIGSTAGITMKESSEDIFRALSDVCVATGGKVINTNNPSHAFKEISSASNNYYLLYYTPNNLVKDNSFKNIEVRVKGRDDLTIQSRKGYFELPPKFWTGG